MFDGFGPLGAQKGLASQLFDNAQLVGAAPSLRNLAVTEEADLHSSCADTFARGGNTLEVAPVRAGHGVGEADIVVVCHQVVHFQLEVGKGGTHLRKHVYIALRTRPLRGRGVMVEGVRGKNFAKAFQVAGGDAFAHLLLHFYVLGGGHGWFSFWHRCAAKSTGFIYTFSAVLKHGGED